VLFNQAAMTLACLRSIIAMVDIAAEIIIIDNASSDQTSQLLTRLDGARITRNVENRHFLHAVNQGAVDARGKALLLLNNDARLRPGTLGRAWQTLMADLQTGAVGGPIVLPDGSLQEAGSIIFSDGTCLGYGRGADPADGAFGFQREVDYASGAFLLIRLPVFQALGGLDTAYAPAYYEETDFCMRLRAAGYRVMYEPGAIIDHFEFASATSTAAALELQRRHHAIFLERHRDTLASAHHTPGTAPLVARMRDAVCGRVLVIEDRVPYPSLGTGYPRAARMLRALLDDGWFVTLYPLVFPTDDKEERRSIFSPRLEVMHGAGESQLGAFLQARAGYYQHIVVCRPHNMLSFLRNSGRGTTAHLIYDAEAVFAEREIARAALAGTPLSETESNDLRVKEMALARSADTVLAVSESEAMLFRSAGCQDVRVLGHALTSQTTQTNHAERQGLLFVGALHDDPSPNVDGLLWFVEQVMPRLDAMIGTDWQLCVAGRADARRVQALQGSRIKVLGRVPDLTSLYAQCRVSIAPMRYAGGIPHKVHEAAAHGLPVVTTPLLARQLGWQHEVSLLAASTDEEFATCCAKLYRDADLWARVQTGAEAALRRDCDESVFVTQVAAMLTPP
jgi:GT2 family glycosyltransferase